MLIVLFFPAFYNSLHHSLCSSFFLCFYQEHTVILDIELLKEPTVASEKRPIDCFVLRDEEVPVMPRMYSFSSFGLQSHAFLRQMANGLCGHKIELSKLLAPGLNL